MSRFSELLRKRRRGFTLVELAVVVVIIGVLAAFGVPRFLQAVERSKAAEAFGYLSALRSAQERYQAREGKYATDFADLDIDYSDPKYFDVPTAITSAAEDQWELTLTRKAGASGYGAYTVTFNQDGYDSAGSDIPAEVNPIGDSTTGGGTGN
jgi:prepilin-type N-terminal cleavage/methylation domain-containing protein